MSTVIQVEGLSKSYLISHRAQESYRTLRDTASNGVRKFARVLSGRGSGEAARETREEFWALRDVSFKVEEGERLGIIGRNGAGKSTLLKILSRITEPTRGRVSIAGRVASLLEVGTGFHPELTGRENIYLNGAVLGMTRAEVRRKFDEIVAFAEVERFLDTPVKRYSSGMYVRLAFAVAAHLEPEILVIDEVLAVGDLQFQRKCLGKMEQAGREGRTVLFVSHNMQTIRALCSRAILLNAGGVVADGETSEIMSAYLRRSDALEARKRTTAIIQSLQADRAFKPKSVRLLQDERDADDYIVRERPFQLEIRYKVAQQTIGLRIYVDLYDDQETLLLRSFHDVDHESAPVTAPGDYVSTVTFPADFLGPLAYTVKIRAGIFGVRPLLREDDISIPITVRTEKPYCRAYPGDSFVGKLWMEPEWINHGERLYESEDFDE